MVNSTWLQISTSWTICLEVSACSVWNKCSGWFVVWDVASVWRLWVLSLHWTWKNSHMILTGWSVIRSRLDTDIAYLLIGLDNFLGLFVVCIGFHVPEDSQNKKCIHRCINGLEHNLFSLVSASVSNLLDIMAPFQYPIIRLIVRYHKVSKPRDLYLELADRPEIWQPPRQ